MGIPGQWRREHGCSMPVSSQMERAEIEIEAEMAEAETDTEEIEAGELVDKEKVTTEDYNLTPMPLLTLLVSLYVCHLYSYLPMPNKVT